MWRSMSITMPGSAIHLYLRNTMSVYKILIVVPQMIVVAIMLIDKDNCSNQSEVSKMGLWRSGNAFALHSFSNMRKIRCSIHRWSNSFAIC